MAEHASIIRNFLIRAEDARLIKDMYVNQIYTKYCTILCFHCVIESLFVDLIIMILLL